MVLLLQSPRPILKSTQNFGSPNVGVENRSAATVTLEGNFFLLGLFLSLAVVDIYHAMGSRVEVSGCGEEERGDSQSHSSLSPGITSGKHISPSSPPLPPPIVGTVRSTVRHKRGRSVGFERGGGPTCFLTLTIAVLCTCNGSGPYEAACGNLGVPRNYRPRARTLVQCYNMPVKFRSPSHPLLAAYKVNFYVAAFYAFFRTFPLGGRRTLVKSSVGPF